MARSDCAQCVERVWPVTGLGSGHGDLPRRERKHRDHGLHRTCLLRRTVPMPAAAESDVTTAVEQHRLDASSSSRLAPVPAQTARVRTDRLLAPVASRHGRCRRERSWRLRRRPTLAAAPHLQGPVQERRLAAPTASSRTRATASASSPPTARTRPRAGSQSSTEVISTRSSRPGPAGRRRRGSCPAGAGRCRCSSPGKAARARGVVRRNTAVEGGVVTRGSVRQARHHLDRRATTKPPAGEDGRRRQRSRGGFRTRAEAQRVPGTTSWRASGTAPTAQPSQDHAGRAT